MSRTRAPVPSSADAHLAARAIWERHREVDDPYLWRLTEALEDLQAVVSYVATHYQHVKHSVRAADALDVLVIIRWQRRQLDLRERNMITLARQWRVSWAALAGPLGVKSHQAAQQLYQRLLAWSEDLDLGLETGGLRSEVAYRRSQVEKRATTTDPEALTAYPSPRDPAPATVTAVLDLLRRLYEQRRNVPEDLVPDLAAALTATNPTHTLGLVRSVVADLVAAAGELPAPLAALAREAHALLHR